MNILFGMTNAKDGPIPANINLRCETQKLSIWENHIHHKEYYRYVSKADIKGQTHKTI